VPTVACVCHTSVVTRPAAIYCRLSQDRTGAGVVVERQERDCRDLAKTLGWDVVRVFVDNDVSAYRKKVRPGYKALMAALVADEVDAVLVWHADRLHRSPKELEHYIDVCEPRGVITRTVRAGELDLATASGRMVARQLGAVARYESEQIAGRTKAGKQDAAQRGAWSGGQRIYGYEIVPQSHRASEESALRVIPAEAEVVREASRRVLAGDSLRSVSRSLNERGLRTTKGMEWSGPTLRKVLLRPATAGLRASGGEVLGKGNWAALLPEDEWRGVVALLTDPSRKTTDKYARTYLGSGLYRCGVCQGALTGNTTAGGSHGNRKAAYRCRTADRQGQSHVVRDVEALDSIVIEVLKARLKVPDAIEAASASATSTAALQTEGAAVRARLEAAATGWASGELTQAQLLSATRTMRSRLEAIDREVAEAQGKTMRRALMDGDVASTWDALALDQRRGIVAGLMEVVVLPRSRRGRLPGGSYFDPSSVRITWRTP
jgi:site-specific DNA recombinase